MSPALANPHPEAAAVSAPLPLCRSLLNLLNLYTRAKVGSMALGGRSLHGIGEWHGVIQHDGGPFLTLPSAILEKLEEFSWALTLSAVVREPFAMPLVWVTFDLAPTFADGPRGWAHYPDETRLAAARGAVERFGVAPSVIIDGYSVLAVGWTLTEPLTDEIRARDLLRRLAEKLGAPLPEASDPLSATISLPGSIVRNVGTVDVPVVQVVTLDQDRTVSGADLEAALRPPPARKKGVTA